MQPALRIGIALGAAAVVLAFAVWLVFVTPGPLPGPGPLQTEALEPVPGNVQAGPGADAGGPG